MENNKETVERKMETRWGSALREGFVVVPRALLNRQADLGLESGDVVVLLNLLASWWEEGNYPYLAVRTLSTRMGLSLRTTQRSLQRLETAGFLARERMTRGTGQDAGAVVTRYDLSGTVHRLQDEVLRPVRRAPKPQPSKFNAGHRVPEPLTDTKLEGFKEVA